MNKGRASHQASGHALDHRLRAGKVRVCTAHDLRIELPTSGAQPKRVTDEMFIEAAHALADQMTPAELAQGLLFPPQANILETEIKIAARVAKVVFDSHLATVERPDDYEAFIRSHVYKPEYRSFV